MRKSIKNYMNKFFTLLIITAGFIACSDKIVVERMTSRGEGLVDEYVASFNATDDELYIQEFDNSEAADFMKANVPYFECPDKELEKTYYFRWWTFRKHIKETEVGHVITEFLPPVRWAGPYNTINCPACFHIREGRWLKDELGILAQYIDFWLGEQGDAYNMVAYGGAAKEWFEQADAFDAACAGKSAAEIAGLMGEDYKGNADVQAAGCTIYVSGLVAAASKI